MALGYFNRLCGGVEFDRPDGAHTYLSVFATVSWELGPMGNSGNRPLSAVYFTEVGAEVLVCPFMFQIRGVGIRKVWGLPRPPVDRGKVG